MKSRLLAFLAVASLFTGALYAADTPSTDNTTAKRYGTWGVDLAGMDTSVKPGDDFFKYVNGKWAATTQIPPDKTSYGAFLVLRDLSEARVHGILDKWAADKTLAPASSTTPRIVTVHEPPPSIVPAEHVTSVALCVHEPRVLVIWSCGGTPIPPTPLS